MRLNATQPPIHLDSHPIKLHVDLCQVDNFLSANLHAPTKKVFFELYRRLMLSESMQSCFYFVTAFQTLPLGLFSLPFLSHITILSKNIDCCLHKPIAASASQNLFAIFGKALLLGAAFPLA